MEPTSEMGVLQQALALTEELDRLTQQVEWPDVGEHLAERDRLLRDFFRQAPAELLADPRVRDLSEKILDLNERIVARVRMSQKDLLSDLRGLRDGRAATSAYRRVNLGT